MAGERPPLNEKQQRFIEEYLVDSNATQAAIRAGYSAKTARSIGARLLTHVDIQAAIADRKQVRSCGLEVDNARVLRELGRVADSDLRNYIEWGPDGVRMKASCELTEDQARAVLMVTEKRRTIPQRTGEPIVEVEMSFRLHPKIAALDALAKAGGLYTQRDQKALDKVLDIVLLVLRKFVPEADVERAILEFGSMVDRMREARALPAGP